MEQEGKKKNCKSVYSIKRYADIRHTTRIMTDKKFYIVESDRFTQNNLLHKQKKRCA